MNWVKARFRWNRDQIAPLEVLHHIEKSMIGQGSTLEGYDHIEPCVQLWKDPGDDDEPFESFRLPYITIALPSREIEDWLADIESFVPASEPFDSLRLFGMNAVLHLHSVTTEPLATLLREILPEAKARQDAFVAEQQAKRDRQLDAQIEDLKRKKDVLAVAKKGTRWQIGGMECAIEREPNKKADTLKIVWTSGPWQGKEEEISPLALVGATQISEPLPAKQRRKRTPAASAKS